MTAPDVDLPTAPGPPSGEGPLRSTSIRPTSRPCRAEPDWLRRRPARRARARTTSCRSRPTSCSRSTSTCAPPRSTDSGRTPRRVTAPADAPHVVPEGAAALDRDRARTASLALELDPAEARAAGVILDTFANAASRAIRPRPSVLTRRRRTLPADDKFAQFPRGAGARASSCTSRPASCSSEPIVVRWAAGAPAARSSPARSSSSARAHRRRSSRSTSRPGATARRRRPEPVGGARPRSSSAAARTCFAGDQDFGPNTSPSTSPRHARQGAQLRWALAQLGAGSSTAGSTTASWATALGRARSRSASARGAAVRPDQLHAPHRRRTRPAICSPRAYSSTARGYFKGMIAIDKPANGTD